MCEQLKFSVKGSTDYGWSYLKCLLYQYSKTLTRIEYTEVEV